MRTSNVKPYLGDRYFDKDQDWHIKNQNQENQSRTKYEPILLLFYKLNPNYIIKFNSTIIELKQGDRNFLNINSLLTFAAITPVGGPNYKVYTNEMINPE